MTGDAAVLARRFDVDDLRRELATAPIEVTVVVQTVSDLAETEEFIATAAGSSGTIAGVVGWVDLTAPDVSDTLARLMRGSAGSLLVGIRHQLQDEDDAQWLLRDDVQRGLRAVDDAGLVFDLLVRARELPAAIEAASRLPHLRFVLDHAGKPSIADRAFEPWATLVTSLAGNDNVSCKLSGLVTEAAPEWAVADLAPYAQHVLAVFGWRRLMFGSDWPVCTLRTSYRGAYDVATELIADLSPGERDAVLGDNAVTTYGLVSTHS
jgi:L-fuconolactonase